MGPLRSSLAPVVSLLLCSSAALARFDHHVGELLHARRAAYEVHDGEGLQVLGDAAGRGRGLGVHLVVQGQDLRAEGRRGGGASAGIRWSLKASRGCPEQAKSAPPTTRDPRRS